jgi:dinuclear metal center YbgI/SA1388 family protein
MKSLDLDTPLGTMLQALIAHRSAVVAAHTNLDSVQGGVNDILAAHLSLDHIAILQPSLHDAQCGLGRVGTLPSPAALGDLAASIKVGMAIPHVRYAGDPHLQVHHVALCSGSGSGMTAAFLRSDAQVFITGDVRYHDALEIEGHGRGVIDIGHFESEHIVLEALARRLTEQMTLRRLDVTVETCATERTPFRTI